MLSLSSGFGRMIPLGCVLLAHKISNLHRKVVAGGIRTRRSRHNKQQASSSSSAQPPTTERTLLRLTNGNEAPQTTTTPPPAVESEAQQQVASSSPPVAAAAEEAPPFVHESARKYGWTEAKTWVFCRAIASVVHWYRQDQIPEYRDALEKTLEEKDTGTWSAVQSPDTLSNG